MLDWEMERLAQHGQERWGALGRTTEDIDVVIVDVNDRGWGDALQSGGWTRHPEKVFRWTSPAQAEQTHCHIDLLGQYGGQGGGSVIRQANYWGGPNGAYICRVLRSYQGQRKFPSLLVEPFWDPYMKSYEWVRLNHMGLVLSKISAVALVIKNGDEEHRAGLTPRSRLLKDLQDVGRLLHPEVALEVSGWHAQAILENLVDALVEEVIGYIALIKEAALNPERFPNLPSESRAAVAAAAALLPTWSSQ